MDFGIARSAYLPGMTQTGALIGTPEYMSPEQARGEKLTERSDLFPWVSFFTSFLPASRPIPPMLPLALVEAPAGETKTPMDVDPTIPSP